MGAIFNFFRRCLPEDPIRIVANVRDKNRVSNILEDIQGIGCRIEKPTDREGLGWRVVVDGSSDVELPEGAEAGVTAKHFDVYSDDPGSVKIRCGSWERTIGDDVIDAPVLVSGAYGEPSEVTSKDMADSFECDISGLSDGTKYATAYIGLYAPVVYLGVTGTEPNDPNTMVIAHFEVTDGELDGAITQDWNGGNIKDGVSTDTITEALGDIDTSTALTVLDGRYLIRDDIDLGIVGGQPNNAGLRTSVGVRGATFGIEGGRAGTDFTSANSKAVIEKGIVTNEDDEFESVLLQAYVPSLGKQCIIEVYGRVAEELD